jgi:hypothetical protein
VLFGQSGKLGEFVIFEVDGYSVFRRRHGSKLVWHRVTRCYTAGIIAALRG